MDIALLMARIFLALIFGIAGTAKATDLAGTKRALIDFGVPERVAVPLGWCLPFLELAVALALLPLTTAWPAAIAAVALMSVFTLAIGVSLMRGRTPECNCFGQLHSKPVSWSMFARNLMLAAVAALIVARGKAGAGLSAFDWLAGLKAVEIVSLVLSLLAIGLLYTSIVYLRRMVSQQSMVLARIEAMKKVIDEDYAEPAVEREDAAPPGEGLPVGAPAPEFSLASNTGDQVTLEDLLGSGKPVLLLFVSPNCAPCETLLPAVRDWEEDYGDRLTIALLSKGSLKDNQDRVAKYGATHLLLVGKSNVTEEYQSRWTPAGVLVSRFGRIASQNVYGDEEIRRLATRAAAPVGVSRTGGSGAGSNGHRLHVPVGESGLKVGDPVPAFSLSDLQGNVVNTENLLGTDTLLLFWDPGCPFCQAMSNDLSRFEKTPPKGAPRLLFVASGDLEKVKAASENYKSVFVHDREFNVGSLLGTKSTPSAVLIDREGKIASSLATGGPNVLALAGVRNAMTPVEYGS